jgi:hypothetical protein
MAANWKPALAALLLAGTALTAWGINITLTDSSNNSVTCATTGLTTIDTSGNISTSVSGGPGCDLSGGGSVDPPPPGSFNLSVSKNGTGSGTVTSSPIGISCGTDCSESYTSGIQVTLTAEPASGSTFGGWSGACSGSTGLSCTLAMLDNLSVTATFNSSGGGGSGGDPGAGLWIDGTNFVHDRGSLTELYVPRCVPSQYNNCRFGGRLSEFDTLVAGQVWSMRIPVGSGLAATTYPFGVQRAETGESLNAYDFAISTTPGSFDVGSACKQSGAGEIRVHDPARVTPSKWTPSCPITANTTYYLNVRPQAETAGAQNCGSGSSNACRYRITLPTGFPYSQ